MIDLGAVGRGIRELGGRVLPIELVLRSPRLPRPDAPAAGGPIRSPGDADGGGTGSRRDTEGPNGAPAAPAALHSEARILSVLSQFAGMQFVLACTALVRNKIVALRLGPHGFGEIVQIAAVTAVASTLAAFGMGVSLSRNSAKCRSVAERQTLLANANGIVLCLGGAVVATALPLLASGHLLPLVALTPSHATVWAAVLFIAAIPVEGLKTSYLALLQGILDVRGLAVRRTVGVFVATVVAVPIVWFFGFVGAAIQTFLLSVMVAVLLGRRCRALGYAPLDIRLDKRVVATLASFGIVSMASGFAHSFADTAVRTHLIDTAGAAANGLLQAPVSLATTVKGIVLSSIGSVSLATIASKTDRREISLAVERLLNVVVPLGALGLGLLGLLGVPSLALLYSERFGSAATLFPWILTADLLTVFAWVVGAPLLANGDRVLWLALEGVHAAARWGVAVVLIPHLGATGVVVGHLAAIALHLTLILGVYRFRYALHLSANHLLRLAGGVVLIAFLSITGVADVRPVLILAAVATWMGYGLHYAKHTEIWPMLRGRFQRG